MVSLYKRAKPSQKMILRIVEGAVRNVAHYHPEWAITSPKLPRSVAKRVVGTLTAAWRSVLVVDISPQSNGIDDTTHRQSPDGRIVDWLSGVVGEGVIQQHRGDADTSTRRPLTHIHIKHLRSTLGIWAGEARKAGDNITLEAYVRVLRYLHDITQREG